MTNPEKNGFLKTPIIDTHLHLSFEQELDEMVKSFENIMTYYEYDSIVLCVYPQGSAEAFPADNAKALYCKERINTAAKSGRVFVYG